MENPQDLLMHIVENDFEYMETHLDATNSDGLWGNEEEWVIIKSTQIINKII